MRSTMEEVIRYSPRPIESYTSSYAGAEFGPAKSALLGGDAEAWNLAFISYPYEDFEAPSDPHFTTHVRRTLQFVINTGKIDLASVAKSGDCVRHWLRMPAPQFLKRLGGMPRLTELPMFRAYGPRWIGTLENRVWLCHQEETPGGDPGDVSSAASLLERFRKRDPQ